MIEFRVEWQDAPGVRDLVLARSWGRLEILVKDNPIQFLDTKAGSLRKGTYGSMLPLASWVIENWWHILHESIPLAKALDGARALLEQEGSKYRAWIHRHNLIAAREGMALPDLTIFRDGNRISIVTVRDPENVVGRGRFITDSLADISVSAAQAGISGLVDAVLARLTDLATNELDEVRANWAAIQHCQADEVELYGALAALGQDPYDPDELDENLVNLLQRHVLSLAEPLRQDLLEAASLQSLENDSAYVEALFEKLQSLQGSRTHVSAAPTAKESRGGFPHLAGYQRARRFRQELNIPPDVPIMDLKDVAMSRWNELRSLSVDTEKADIRINGLVGVGDRGQRVLVSKPRAPRTQRFLLARAIHQWLHSIPEYGYRLLTRAPSWEQRASKAFAAELLAPAEALREHLDSEPDLDLIGLANRFQVNESVINYQMENHGLD